MLQPQHSKGSCGLERSLYLKMLWVWAAPASPQPGSSSLSSTCAGVQDQTGALKGGRAGDEAGEVLQNCEEKQTVIIEGEYVPVAGDEVTYKMCTIPPKNEKLQAVEVVITHLAPGTKHETWSGHVISS
ncbi:hypothetical protein Nmel_014438 [Mimus melanotis]